MLILLIIMNSQEQYNLDNGLKENPKCICGKELKFICYKVGYRQYCSASCRAKNQKRSKESIEKMKKSYKQTMLNKYGVENYWQTEESKQLKRDFSNRKTRSKESYQESTKKVQQTNLEKYGNVCSLHGSNQEKTNKLLEEKYGKNGLQKLAGQVASQNRWQKHFNSLKEYCNREQIEIIKFDVKNSKNIFRCKVCNQEFHRINGFPVCPQCNKADQFISKKEKEILEYIKSIYNGQINSNDRHIIGKELDIYLPELKIAIEYNGTFWHGFSNYTNKSISEFKKEIELKRLKCKELGIRLINIDECDYLDRPEVFKQFISDTILQRKRIFARKCIIKEIDTKTAKEFLEKYHVNGFRGGSNKLGLYYNSELLIVAVFGKYKQNYECIRLCYKTGYDVIGGWAKIQKYFGKRFLHYVNLKYFEGENKTGIGFRFVMSGNKVLHRNALQKKTGLLKYCKNYDSSLTDFQNCINNGMIAVFDVGNDIRWYN